MFTVQWLTLKYKHIGEEDHVAQDWCLEGLKWSSNKNTTLSKNKHKNPQNITKRKTMFVTMYVYFLRACLLLLNHYLLYLYFCVCNYVCLFAC